MLLKYLEEEDFTPSKPLEELLPALKTKPKDSSQMVQEPSIDYHEPKATKSSIKKASAILGLHSAYLADEHQEDTKAYMLGKEHICTPIDLTKLMPMLREYTQKLWQKNHGLMLVLQHNTPTYNEATNILTFHIYNNSQQQLIQQKSDVLLKYLRTELNNYQLKIDFAFLDKDDKGPKSPASILKEMIDKNEHLQSLLDELSLELEF